MGHWCYIDDFGHFNTRAVDSTDSRLTTLTGTFNIDLNLPQTQIVCDLCAIGRCHLSCIGSILFRTAEAHLTCRAPADYLTDTVCNGDDYVVESRVNESHSDCVDFDNTFFNCSWFLCHNSLNFIWLLFSCLLRSSSCPYGYVRCSWCSDREREDPNGDGFRDSSRYPSVV